MTHRGTRVGTRVGAVLLTVPLTGLLAVLGAAPAHADGYRYWSFWQQAAGSAQEWAYATQGPATLRPGDGGIVGFRFAVSKDSADAAKPRAAAGFGAVCGRTPAKEGAKRVAVVLDFGTAADAPSGESPPAARTACAQVATDASAAEALAAVAKPLRYNSDALLCAIAGYPKSGCGEKVDGGQETKSGAPAEGKKDAPREEKGDGGPSAGLIGGIAVVAVLGAAAVWQTRRRRRG
ncbi:SCO2322 family protein [Streptomyces sp. NPDC026206]|uniref:SCO2322 family protein n=1 Tax=Streptomyces sp. NPDC026206 TaxID=3157089 RepID=UPI0033E46482